MDPGRHARISELFCAVCDLTASERARLLRDQCRDDPALADEVQELVAAEASTILDQPALGEGFSLTGAVNGLDPASAAPISGRIGPYTIRQCLSEGGIAIIYEAEQEHPRRVVALKMLRGGLASRSALRRFQLEAEVLARLEHPGVARIYEAGLYQHPSDPPGSPGVPYFAMEFIDGLPITAYANERGLSPQERMGLVASVCDAVQYAHQQGIIHRDLKPANILVDRHGQPKVLDFGVARVTDADLLATTLHTEAGQLVGTLPYMSPEQIQGDPGLVDTRSDVYALGVILYEMLAGRHPFPVANMPIPEAARMIREGIPPALGSCHRSLRGDPNTIAMHALEKVPARRYASAAELAADLRRCIANEPIVAKPASALYYLRKMARRHAGAFTGTAVAAVALVATSVVSTWFLFETARAKDHAESALFESRSLSDYLLGVFLGSPDEPTISRTALLEKAEAQFLIMPIADPRLEAKLREYVGHGWHKLNYLDRAEPHLVRAIELRRSLGVVDADLAKSLLLLAMQRLTQGRVAEGQDLLRETLAVRREILGPGHMIEAPDHELMYFVVVYVPDEPEAARELDRRRLARMEVTARAPGTPPGALVFEDRFEGAVLEPAWSVRLSECSDWIGELDGSRLTVTAIVLPPDAERHSTAVTSTVELSRSLPMPLGDFRAEAHVGWDTAERLDALQAFAVHVSSGGRQQVASALYSDFWLRHQGSRAAYVFATEQANRLAVSGQDTLPSSGSAVMAIERMGDRISVYWNSNEIIRGVCSHPITEIELEFSRKTPAAADGVSSFGALWVESITVFGKAAYPLE